MGAARAVLEAKAVHRITLLAQRSSGGCTGKSGAHDDDGVLAAIRGIDQLHFEAGLFPLLFNWTGWNFGFKHLFFWQTPRFTGCVRRESGACSHSPQCSQPASTEMGTETKPAKIRIATIRENVLRLFVL